MACGNNQVSRSGLHSAPAPLTGPAGPAPTRSQLTPEQLAVVKQQARSAMEQAERKASAALTPAAANGAVKEARRALDVVRRMRAPMRERAALVRDLERKLEDVKRTAVSATELHHQAVRATEHARRDQELISKVPGGDRLSPAHLGVPPYRSAQSAPPVDRVRAKDHTPSGATPANSKNVRQRQQQSKWEPRGSQPPDVGVIAGTDHVVSFKTGGPTGDQTLIADGDYSDDKDGFDQNHNHYGSAHEGGWIDQDRGHYTGPDH
jgi:hypothetical protein